MCVLKVHHARHPHGEEERGIEESGDEVQRGEKHRRQKSPALPASAEDTADAVDNQQNRAKSRDGDHQIGMDAALRSKEDADSRSQYAEESQQKQRSFAHGPSSVSLCKHQTCHHQREESESEVEGRNQIQAGEEDDQRQSPAVFVAVHTAVSAVINQEHQADDHQTHHQVRVDAEADGCDGVVCQ